jgi:sec-independent protein translocase protein TatA
MYVLKNWQILKKLTFDLFFILVLINSINIFARYLKNRKMGNLGATEIILILLVVVLLFGGRKIPELMKGIGQGMKEFKKASRLEDEPDKMSAEPKKDEEKK